jgi:hypothetical protein
MIVHTIKSVQKLQSRNYSQCFCMEGRVTPRYLEIWARGTVVQSVAEPDRYVA